MGTAAIRADRAVPRIGRVAADAAPRARGALDSGSRKLRRRLSLEGTVLEAHLSGFQDVVALRHGRDRALLRQNTSGADRDASVARYRPTHVLVAPDDKPWLALAATRLERIADGPDGVLYRVEGGHEPTQPP